MTIMLSDELFKTSGLFSLFKRNISSVYEIGGAYLNSSYDKGYAIQVTMNPEVGFLNIAGRTVMSLIFAVCDGKFIREVTQYYRRELRNVDNVEVWLGNRLALLLRSFILYVVTNGTSNASEFARQFGGMPIPKVCVWIMQMVKTLNSRITVPMSTIQVTFNTVYVLNDDEIDDIVQVVSELNLFGKLSALTLNQSRSAIVVSSRVMNNTVPGTFCSFIRQNNDGQSFVLVDSNYYAHDVFINLLVGTRLPGVDNSILTYHSLPIEFDDVELINRFALWLLNALTGKIEKLVTTTVTSDRSDTFYPSLFVNPWYEGMDTVGGKFDDGSPPKYNE